MDENRTKIQTKDWLLGAVILAAAGILFLFFHFAQGTPGNAIAVRVDGKLLQTYSLLDDGNYPIRTSYGQNILEIKDGKAAITEADCPGNDCVRQGAVSKKGEVIVCLPHKLAAEVITEPGKADEDPGFDTVAK